MVIGQRHRGDALAVVDRCTWSHAGKGCDHCALVALVAVEQLRGDFQRRTFAEKTVGPAAGEHFTVAQLVPGEVGNAEHSGQTVHRLVSGGETVEIRRLHAGIRPIGNPKAQPSLFADLGKHSAQIHMTQVQRQRVGQHGGQLPAEQHLLDRVGGGAALDVADKVPLQRALVVADIQRHQPFQRRRGLNCEVRPAGAGSVQPDVLLDESDRGAVDGKYLVQFHVCSLPPSHLSTRPSTFSKPLSAGLSLVASPAPPSPTELPGAA